MFNVLLELTNLNGIFLNMYDQYAIENAIICYEPFFLHDLLKALAEVDFGEKIAIFLA